MTVRFMIFALLVLLLLFVLGWTYFRRPTVPVRATITVGGTTFQVEVANSTSTRIWGLSGHAPLAENEGMFFIFDTPGNYGFWMKGMTFPLDFVWIRGNKVVGVTENVPVPKNVLDFKTYYPPEPVDRVLEVKAGMVSQWGIQQESAVYFSK